MNDERVERSRQARQVIAGSSLRSSIDTGGAYTSQGGMTPLQQTYLLAVGALIILALLLWLFISLQVASVIIFLLSLALIAGWLVF